MRSTVKRLLLGGVSALVQAAVLFGAAGRLAFLLDSPWALIPGGLTALLIIVRTVVEDRTLLKELDGYQEYAARVRYRLLPGIW